MKKVILCPNPYRDSDLKVAKHAKEILDSIDFETVVCLPFQRDGYDDQLGVPIRQLQQEIKSADLLIAFGGDPRAEDGDVRYLPGLYLTLAIADVCTLASVLSYKWA